MRIFYPNDDGGVSIVVPSPHWMGTMEELAKRDIPKALKYKIVANSVIPSDRSFRNAWEVDEAELTDGVGEQE